MHDSSVRNHTGNRQFHVTFGIFLVELLATSVYLYLWKLERAEIVRDEQLGRLYLGVFVAFMAFYSLVSEFHQASRIGPLAYIEVTENKLQLVLHFATMLFVGLDAAVVYRLIAVVRTGKPAREGAMVSMRVSGRVVTEVRVL